MKIQVHTNGSIEGSERLASHVTRVIEDALEHVRGRITRVEAHLEDENSHKGGDGDKRCMLEARVEGRPPTAVTCHAPTIEQAVHGAAEKLTHALAHTLGRLAGHH
jgi:hypothetical protein